MDENEPQPDETTKRAPKPRAFGVLMSISADRLIAILVIICGILLGVWMFKR